MRNLAILLLLLSFPAYAETWFVNMLIGENEQFPYTVIGQFTVEGQSIQTWSFEYFMNTIPQGSTLNSVRECGREFCTTETAKFISPDHLLFDHEPEGGSAGHQYLELFLSGPLQPGVSLINADFVEEYGNIHLGPFMSGTLIPEPSAPLVILIGLGALLLRRAVSALHKYRKYAILLLLASPAHAFNQGVPVLLEIDPDNLAQRLDARAFGSAIMHRSTDPNSRYYDLGGAVFASIDLRAFNDIGQIWQLGEAHPGHLVRDDPPPNVRMGFALPIDSGPHAEASFVFIDGPGVPTDLTERPGKFMLYTEEIGRQMHWEAHLTVDETETEQRIHLDSTLYLFDNQLRLVKKLTSFSDVVRAADPEFELRSPYADAVDLIPGEHPFTPGIPEPSTFVALLAGLVVAQQYARNRKGAGHIDRAVGVDRGCAA